MVPELPKKFEQLIDGLVATEHASAEAIAEQLAPRPWMNFTVAEIEEPPEQKTELELKKLFDREEANEDYAIARSDAESPSSVVAVSKLSGDFMAACERDKRMQWRSRIRMIAHATARKYGNGNDAGPLRKNTTDYLQRIFMKAETK